MARRWILGSIAVVPVVFVAAPAQAGAASLVRVDGVQITRDEDRAVVTAQVTWNADGARTYDMGFGDLRLVAVSEHGHRPTLLAQESRTVGEGGTQDVRLVITDDDGLAAMRTDNRVVLTASQHRRVEPVGLTGRTYVTVAEAQAFGSRQAHIGTRDCSDTPILPGAMLDHCDLVGADLDGAQVSQHDPKGDEGRTESRNTRLLRADLTGATMVRADMSGASAAGGRLNGTDLTRGKLDNLSLAGAEAVGLIARGATSDLKGEDSGANFFNTRLTDADLSATQFNGVSIAHARLVGADVQDARWQGTIADAASFREADLTGARLGSTPSVYFTDFTRAKLTGTDLTDLLLAWSLLCATSLPAGVSSDPRRDCRDAVETPTKPAPSPDRDSPYVRIAPATLEDGPGPRKISARIAWDAASRSGYGMNAGDIRVVAIDGRTGRPTLIDDRAISDLPETTRYDLNVTDPDALAAMRRGNRIVLTATQHPPFARQGKFTERSYVTVATLQLGPGRGRVGKHDCSRIALLAVSQRLDGLTFCDLAGATLTTAALGQRPMRDADLTGAAIESGSLTAVTLDGSALAGLQATDASLVNVSTVQAFAPAMTMNRAVLRASRMLADTLDDSDFSGARLYSTTTFAAASMRRVQLSNSLMDHTDLAFTDLVGAELDGVQSRNHSSLFLSDLTRATLEDSEWDVDESGELPWTWATLCDTTMPPKSGGISGDRDCPR